MSLLLLNPGNGNCINIIFSWYSVKMKNVSTANIAWEVSTFAVMAIAITALLTPGWTTQKFPGLEDVRPPKNVGIWTDQGYDSSEQWISRVLVTLGTVLVMSHEVLLHFDPLKVGHATLLLLIGGIMMILGSSLWWVKFGTTPIDMVKSQGSTRHANYSVYMMFAAGLTAIVHAFWLYGQKG
jgi:hypothetical protein